MHLVSLNDFYIGTKEVTQKQWKDIMGKNPSNFKNCGECPVENVSWDDVQEFIQKLNAKTGRQYRLPTEAEWEYAAREGGQAVLFGNGKNMANPAEINFAASTDKKPYSVIGIYRIKTTPAGSFPPNALGLYDMSGNVWEWCSDWYNAYYYSNSPSTNPLGPATGTSRVIRGGSYFYNPESLRVAYRTNYKPSESKSELGFRLARTP